MRKEDPKPQSKSRHSAKPEPAEQKSRPDRALPFTTRPQPTVALRRPNPKCSHARSVVIATITQFVSIECRASGAGQRTDRCPSPAAEQAANYRATHSSSSHTQFIAVPVPGTLTAILRPIVVVRPRVIVIALRIVISSRVIVPRIVVP